MAQKSNLLQGTLDMLVLRVLSRGDFHGWAISEQLEVLSERSLRVEEGSLYPALYRMEDRGWLKSEWGSGEKGQRAKFYSLTKAGRRQLAAEKKDWERMTGIVAQVMGS